MLIKIMTDHDNFEQALRRRRVLALGFLAVGLLGFVCYFLLVKHNDALPDIAQGFYLGASGGITFASFVFLLRTQRLLKDPEARKKARIEETDERAKTINSRALQTAGVVSLFLSAAALFVLVAVNRTAALTVFAMLVVEFIVFCFAYVFWSKKL